MVNLDKVKLLNSLKKGQVIKYKYIYSNEDYRIGTISRINNDLNFHKIIQVFTNLGHIEEIPLSLMEIEIL